MTDASRLLINLSVVGERRTGIANYAINLLPFLEIPDTTLLLPRGRESTFGQLLAQYNYVSIPGNLSPDDGRWGHLGRLVWTQSRLPGICWREARRVEQDRQSGSEEVAGGQRESNFEALCNHSVKGIKGTPGRKLPGVLRQNLPLIFSPVPEAPLSVGCRSVVMVHDLIPLRFPNWRSPLTPYFRFYVPQVLAQAEHILCNSRATADEVMQQFGVPAHKLSPVPLAYNAAHFRPLNLPTRNYFIFLGRCDPHKNVDRIVTAFSQLPNRQDYELWIVGPMDARYLPKLRAQATELGVSDQLKVIDYAPYSELPVILGQAIALIFPSLWEGFGLPVLEAMACGTPVITSNLSALPEVAGDAAILVNPDQVEAIGAAMHQVATEAEVRSHLRQAGLARAQQFSWQKTAEQTAAVLRQFL